MSVDTLLYGEYILLDDDLGKGGQAKVIKVRHNEYGYVRALRLGASGLKESSIEWKNFKERCGRLLRLCNGNHPNIVHCHQPKLVSGQAFFEMDFITGDNLIDYLNKNDNYLPIEEVLHMVVQISDALSFCHYGTYEYCLNPDTDVDKDTGESLVQTDENDSKKLVPVNEEARLKLIKMHQVIHNDISSQNIMRCSNGTFVLIDFGLSVEGDYVVSQDSISMRAGHPLYKSPERWDGKAPSTQSDIYSFGVVMYEYLTGHVPFPRPINPAGINDKLEELRQLSIAHHKTKIPSIIEGRKKAFEKKYPDKIFKVEPDIKWLEKAILKCLEKEPDKRFNDGKELNDFIKEHLRKDSLLYKDEEIKKMKESNDELLSEIQSLKKENKDLNKQIMEVTNHRKCKKCGTIPSTPYAIYCRKCGEILD